MPTGAFNSALGPAPVQTPWWEGGELPSPQWGGWFSRLATWLGFSSIISATHTNIGQVIVPRVFQTTQANLSNLGLGLADIGALCWVTDYGHLLQWTGAAWQWGPGESGSGMLVPFAVAPTGSGWHVCDGSAGVVYLKSDGTTGTVTLPNTAGTAAYIKASAAYSPALNAPTAPTSSTPTFAGTPATPTGTVSAISASGSGSVNVTVSGATAVAVAAHTHPAPTFTGNAATPAGTVSAPAISLPGDPVENFAALLYFRQ